MTPPRRLSLFQQGILAFAIGLWGTYGLVEFAAFIFRSTAQ